MLFKRRDEPRPVEPLIEPRPETTAEVIQPASITNFQKDLMNRLDGIEQLLLYIKAKLEAPKEPESYVNSRRLSDVRTELLTVRMVYDDKAGSHEKWNIVFINQGGAQIRIGTFDKQAATTAKIAKVNKTVVQVTYGKNRNEYFDLIGIRDAG